MREKICVALDMEPKEAYMALVKLKGLVGWVKIGPALFTTQTEFGPSFFTTAKDLGFKVFADYKFKDIPSVVAKGISNLSGVADLVTVHVDGGKEMLTAAKAAGLDIKIIGVTLLTSLSESDLRQFGHTFRQYPGTFTEWYVGRMVDVAVAGGIDGIVCSAVEVGNVKKVHPNLFCVTPGLKMAGSQSDQKRSSDPKFAYQQGSDLLVIGRDIYEAPDMAAKIDEIEKWCLGG